MKEKEEKAKSQTKYRTSGDYRKDIPDVVVKLVESCNNAGSFDHVSLEPIPSKDSMIEILHQLQRIFFPGYFVHTQIDKVNL